MATGIFFDIALNIPADPTTQEVMDAITKNVSTKEDTKDLFTTLCETYHGEEWFDKAVLGVFTAAMKHYEDELEADMFGC